ncbi:MAG: serine/threonine-protein kinase, partial [Nannocystaceae bacterium]
FEKLVALKRVHDAHQGNHEFIQMLMDEARLAANLDHPNIAPVFDFGRDGATYFFTMEYVRGKDLRQLVRAVHARGERVPLTHVLTMATGVAAGLHYAHELCGPDGTPFGVVHRDVSPSNILVTYDGGAKIVDFGIAKAAILNPSTTASGTLKGKVSYMSPEQVRGEELDRRSDIYTLGIILWELTTHSRLYRGAQYDVLEAIATKPAPPPSSVDPEYPKGLEAVIMRALAPNPDDRYPTAEALQVALEDFASEQRISLSSAKFAAYMRDLFGEQIESERSQLMQASGLHAVDSTGVDYPPTTQLSREQIAALSASQLALTPPPVGHDTVDHGEATEQNSRPLISFGIVGLSAIIACALIVGIWGAVVFLDEPSDTAAPVLERSPAPEQKTPPTRPNIVHAAPASSEPSPPNNLTPPLPPPKEPSASNPEPGPAKHTQPTKTRRHRPTKPKPKPAKPAEAWDPDSPLPPM